MSTFKCTTASRYVLPLLFLTLTSTVTISQAADNANPVQESSEGTWRLQFSPFTHHYRYDPDYKPAYLLGVEREAKDGSMYGFALLSNSYGQPSAGAYVGHVFNNVTDRHPELYFKVIAGVVYGYVEPYANRVKFNYNGWVPVIMPAIGWNFNKDWGAQISFFGDVAYTLSVSKRF